MIIDIDPTNGLPIFLQIIEQVKCKIAAGALQEAIVTLSAAAGDPFTY